MAWKECHVVDERLRFIARLLDGEKMRPLCRGVRDLPENRLQDAGPVSGLRPGRPHRPEPAPLPARQSSCPTSSKPPSGSRRRIPRGARRRFGSGCPAVSRAPVPGHQHGPRRARPPWAGDAAETDAGETGGHGALPAGAAQTTSPEGRSSSIGSLRTGGSRAIPRSSRERSSRLPAGRRCRAASSPAPMPLPLPSRRLRTWRRRSRRTGDSRCHWRSTESAPDPCVRGLRMAVGTCSTFLPRAPARVNGCHT
jgi:hypothetical protein